MTRSLRSLALLGCLVLSLALGAPAPGIAQEQPRAGGELIFEERRKLLRTFEKRLYDDEEHYIMTFQWNRIVPYLSKVRGWSIAPSHFLNCQLDTVWLAE
jgi:hypothetical protein